MSTIASALADRASAATEKRQEARKAQFAALAAGRVADVVTGAKGNKVVRPGTAVANPDGTITITLSAPKSDDLRIHDNSDCVTYSVDFSNAIKLRVGDYLAPFSASRPMVLNVFVGDPCGAPEPIPAAE